MKTTITEHGNGDGVLSLHAYLYWQYRGARDPNVFKIIHTPTLKIVPGGYQSARSNGVFNATQCLVARLADLLAGVMQEELDGAALRFDQLNKLMGPARAAYTALNLRCDQQKWDTSNPQNAPLGLSIGQDRIYLACAMPEIHCPAEYTLETPAKVVVSRPLPNWYLNAMKNAPAWANQKQDH